MMLEKAATLLKDADAILVAAGAGMSVPCGVNYWDRHAFKHRYPGMAAKGFLYPYMLIGNGELYANKPLFWGYMAKMIENEHALHPEPPYHNLRNLIGTRDYFVMTSNADGLFARNGFDRDHILTPQGDMEFMQCATPCTHQVWPSETFLAPMRPHVDPATQELTDLTLIPKCPNCGGEMTLNLRGGDYFVEDHWLPKRHQLNAWLSDHITAGKRIAILEIGAGFNTPTVIRWPMEMLALRQPLVSLVRVNVEHPGARFEIPRERFVGLAAGVVETLEELCDRLKVPKMDPELAAHLAEERTWDCSGCPPRRAGESPLGPGMLPPGGPGWDGGRGDRDGADDDDDDEEEEELEMPPRARPN